MAAVAKRDPVRSLANRVFLMISGRWFRAYSIVRHVGRTSGRAYQNPVSAYPLGDGFVECHHRTPLAALPGVTTTRLTDLAIVCANCHRMLHRRPYHTVEQLREVVHSHRSVQAEQSRSA